MDVTHSAPPNAEPLPISAGQQATEKRANLLLSLVVVASLLAVAYTDWRVASHVNLGYMYILPLSLSALIHPRRISLAFVGVCVILHDLFGPFDYRSLGQLAVRNAMTLVVFSSVVIVLHRLGQQRMALAEIVRRQRDALAEDIAHAAEVQQRLLPCQPPSLTGYDLAGQMRPAKLVSGDYYDYVELSGQDIGLAIADVAGKGAPAALLMASLKTALQGAACEDCRPEDVVSNLNQIVCEVTGKQSYISLFYGRLHTDARRLDYCNGGHFPPLLFRAITGEVTWLDSTGPVLGYFSAAQFRGGSIQLQPGDVLVLYTDGVLDATDGQEKEFSRERLVTLVQSHASESASNLADEIVRSALAFHGSSTPEDDLTLVVLKVSQVVN